MGCPASRVLLAEVGYGTGAEQGRLVLPELTCQGKGRVRWGRRKLAGSRLGLSIVGLGLGAAAGRLL